MNQTYTVNFEKMVYGGDCMGRLPDGRAVFVPFVLPGETAEIGLTECKERFARGNLVKLIQSSPKRVQPPCPYFTECGGCHYQHISYEQQLTLKKELLRDQLERIGKLTKLPEIEITPSPLPFAYRNQVQFHPAPTADPEKLTLGFKKAGSDETLLIDHCLLISEELNQLLSQIDLEPDGGIQRVVFREDSTGEQMIVLAGEDEVPPDLTFELPISAAYTNPNGEDFSLSGNNALLYEIDGKEFYVSPQSFFQVNLPVAAMMVRHILEQLEGKKDLRVLELYSGVGLFTRFIAPFASELIAIESSPSACFNFVDNLDEFDNISLFEGPVEAILPNLIDEIEPIDLVLLDPPRAGLHAKARQALIKLNPSQIIYISCDPGTLARDLKHLAEAGYAITTLHAFDMFPQTKHVETCAYLSKLKSSKHIKVNLELEDLDVTKAESKPTYGEIKKYVMESDGIKVSTLNIAQMKRKHGLIERNNYNLGNGKTKRPPLTAKKEMAIEDAFVFLICFS